MDRKSVSSMEAQAGLGMVVVDKHEATFFKFTIRCERVSLLPDADARGGLTNRLRRPSAVRL